MPTYEYRCTSCGESLEAVQRFTDAPLTVCPACGGELRKVFSPVGVVFKGSGFYKTDSRAAGKPAAAKAEPKTDAGTEKPAAKTEPAAAGGGSAAGSGTATPAAKPGSATGSPATSSTGKVA